jgi:uncharacterized membrane protein YkvA (DUF1232 family)
MNINFDKIKMQFSRKANEYAKDKKKTEKLLKDAIKKAKKSGPLEEIWDKLQLLFGVVRDWIKGDYTKIPIGSIVMIVIALLYFVSPIDIVPDFLPGGLVDDALVLGFVFKQINSDLESYREWLEEREN